MSKIPALAKTVPIAAIVAFFATRWVHGRFGDETFICADGVECDLGSSMSWLLSGLTLLGPFIAVAGFHWSRRLHTRGRLGPFSERAIPDGEQIFEVALFVGAIAATYWLLLNGPSIELVDIERPNTWAEWFREFRAPDELTAEDRQRLDEVPSRRTWFAIGALLGAPAWMSFGTMAGREWYGRKRRKAQRNESSTPESGDDTIHADESVIDLSELDSQELSLIHI